MFDYDLIIIGCGPAGMNACLYATRSNLKTLVIEKNCPGGKLLKAESVENWIGTDKINGVDLSLDMFKHAFSYGGVYEQGNVLDIKNFDGCKEVILKDKTYKCKSIIIATGTSEKKIGIPGEDKFYGKGVSYCAICDGALYKNKAMAVIGDNRHALEECLYLSKYAKKIYLISTNGVSESEANLWSDIKENKSIDIKENWEPISIEGDKFVSSLKIKKGDDEESLEVSAVFPFLGDNPDTKFIDRMNIVDDKNYIEVNVKKETKVEGIFAAGDCTNTSLKQIVTACGDGAIAAMEAYKYIKRKKGQQ